MKISKEAVNNFAAKMVAEKVAVEKQTRKMPQDPVLINTESGMVAVFGHELVSKKELLCMERCFSLPELSLENGGHNVKVIVLRNDNFPRNKKGEPVMASCCPDSGAVIVNLLQTFSKCVEVMLDYEPETSILAIWHRNMLLNYLHEIHHLEMLGGGLILSAAEAEEAEELAEEWSTQKMYELAKSVDVEPSHHAESQFLANQVMELLLENTERWASDQRHMLENHMMYHLPETDDHGGLSLNFKGYLHLMSGDELDDPTWGFSGGEEEKVIQPTAAPVSEPLPTDIFASMGAETMDVEEPYDPNMADHGFNEDEEIGFGGGDYIKQVNVEFDGGSTQPESSPVVEGPAVKTHPETGLTPEQTGVIARGVYFKCYTHIFSQCQRVLHSDVGFNDPEAVCVTPIQLTEQEKTVVVKMDCLSENGRWCPGMATANGLRGSIMKNTKLPTYMLYINNNGVEEARMLLPQNPSLRKSDGQYKDTALQARGGTSIMYIMEADDAVIAANPSKKFKMKIIDKVFTK